MRVAIALLAGVFLSLVAAPPAAVRAEGREDLTALALGALSEDRAEAGRAAAGLRARGPAGLDAMFAAYGAAIERHRAKPTASEPMWERLSAALDAVAAQKDAWAAGLYWYTDLGEAQRAARESGRPILSLRLLGTLDTEFSCANSRFFRTALYPDAAVGKALREGFVLHWQSHRPVPRLTIDFGDGRKIERTITGNSVHYVLTPDGRVVDVIPGLYGPAAFARALGEARAMAVRGGERDFAAALAAYHARQAAAARAAWAEDLRKVGVPVVSGALTVQPAGDGKPTAMAGARITVAKSAAEVRPIAALAADRALLAAGTADDATWARVAALHAADGRLDATSRAVIASKAGDAVKANELTTAKRRVEDPVTRIVRNFERSVAEDTVRNEYLFHTQVHDWFASGQVPASLDELNERVYAQLFLMPKSDPFLGLVPADTYTGLPADGGVGR